MHEASVQTRSDQEVLEWHALIWRSVPTVTRGNIHEIPERQYWFPHHHETDQEPPCSNRSGSPINRFAGASSVVTSLTEKPHLPKTQGLRPQTFVLMTATLKH